MRRPLVNLDKPPAIKGIAWNKNKKSGGFDAREFQVLPDGTEKRRHLGYLGKKRLAAWREQFNEEQLRAVVEQWVSEARKGKGIL